MRFILVGLTWLTLDNKSQMPENHCFIEMMAFQNLGTSVSIGGNYFHWFKRMRKSLERFLVNEITRKKFSTSSSSHLSLLHSIFSHINMISKHQIARSTRNFLQSPLFPLNDYHLITRCLLES